MNGVAAVLAFWSVVAVQARPGGLIGGGTLSVLGGGIGGYGGITSSGSIPPGPQSLVGVPGDFSDLHYATSDIQDLGTVYEGQIPPQTVKISNTIAVKIPKPYPVKVPHGVPVPIPVEKPYPVPVQQLIKVPHPVPVEVVKTVPVPVEVPKPYPVPANEFKGYGGGGGLDSYGGGFGGHQQLSQSYGIPSTSYGEPIQGGDSYDSYASHSESSSGYDSGHEGAADQSAGYPALAAAAPEEQESSAEDGSHSE